MLAHLSPVSVVNTLATEDDGRCSTFCGSTAGVESSADCGLAAHFQNPCSPVLGACRRAVPWAYEVKWDGFRAIVSTEGRYASAAGAAGT